MTAQRHVIKRQVLELSTRGGRCTPAFQEEMSRLWRARLWPILDRVCDELTDPDTLYRIDRLEVDLGSIPRARLEPALLEAFEARFPQELEAAFRASRGSGQDGSAATIASHLELVAGYAHEGVYPWWVDASRPCPLAASLGYLRRHAAGRLRALLTDLVREPRPRRRLILTLDDSVLAGLLENLAPEAGAGLITLCPQLSAWLGGLEHPLRTSLTDRREIVWGSALRVAAGATRSPAGGSVAQLRGLLEAIAGRVGQPFPTLVARLHRHLATELGGWPEAIQVAVAGLHQEAASPDSKDGGKEGHPAAIASHLERVARFAREAVDASGVDVSRLGLLSESLDYLHRHAAPTLRALLTELAREPASRRRLIGLLETVASRMGPPSGEGGARLETPGTVEPGSWAEAIRVAAAGPGAQTEVVRPDPDTATVDAVPAPAFDLRFSEADEVYIDNAGLVLLWPFLAHFFEHLGLTEAKSFKDEPARHRAVGLLQHLVTEDLQPAEHLVPLNKILCGMDAAEVFDFGPPVTGAEAAECGRMLTAAIGHASILRNMSLPGFRGTFLIRRGQISVRDETWLLRVERETYDIVLDRFPWSFNWVRLPWMRAPVRVEW